MKLGICQLAVSANKAENLVRAREMLKSVRSAGADMAVLPEMFCINYVPEHFAAAAEEIPSGESCIMLSQTAKDLSMTIIGGSVPEITNGNLFNTSVCFSKTGEFIGKYRKAHLFDVDFDGLRFMESETISPGNMRPLIIDEPIKTAVAICFDIRFPEWSRIMMDAGADLIALPAAFSTKTGPKHWELLLRARALDNQCFVVGVAPAASNCSYGHSMLVSPTGAVLCELGTDECFSVVELPLDDLQYMRGSIPIKNARRFDLY